MAGLETFCRFIGYPPLLFWTTDDITLLTSFHAGLPKGHEKMTVAVMTTVIGNGITDKKALHAL
jgi:hypothetical protein